MPEEVGCIVPLELHDGNEQEDRSVLYPLTVLFVYKIDQVMAPDGVNTIVPTPTVDADGNWMLPSVCRTQIMLDEALLDELDSGLAVFETYTFNAAKGMDKATVEFVLKQIFSERRALMIASFRTDRFKYVSSPITVFDTDL